MTEPGDEPPHDDIETRGLSLTRPGAESTPSRSRRSVADIEASYVMEGGKLLPEPGSPEEDDWKVLAT